MPHTTTRPGRWGASTRVLIAALSLACAAAPIDAARAGQASATFSVGITILPAGTTALRPADPLAASTWLAADGPWAGSLRFDGKTRTVHLALAGARPVDATYSTVIEKAPARNDVAGSRGRLHITQANGLTVELAFRLSPDGRALTLVFERSAIVQRYVRVARPDQARDPHHAGAAETRE